MALAILDATDCSQWDRFFPALDKDLFILHMRFVALVEDSISITPYHRQNGTAFTLLSVSNGANGKHLPWPTSIPPRIWRVFENYFPLEVPVGLPYVSMNPEYWSRYFIDAASSASMTVARRGGIPDHAWVARHLGDQSHAGRLTFLSTDAPRRSPGWWVEGLYVPVSTHDGPGRVLVTNELPRTVVISDYCNRGEEDKTGILLRSEVLVCVRLLHPRLRDVYDAGTTPGDFNPPLKVSNTSCVPSVPLLTLSSQLNLVTFGATCVRVVQIICHYSGLNPRPRVVFTERACFKLGTSLGDFDPMAARSILGWIMHPDDPLEEV